MADALGRHGLNVSIAERSLAPLSMLWTAIWNPFNVLLTLLACINIAIHDVATFSVMIAMVVASTALRCVSVPFRLSSVPNALSGTGRR